MPPLPVTPPGGETDPAEKQPKRASTAIGRAVMSALGSPDDFLRVTIRKVTVDGYRVNVVAGTDATSTRIAHSYFVTADEDGNVTASSPAIARLY
jgi:hypothetical protein